LAFSAGGDGDGNPLDGGVRQELAARMNFQPPCLPSINQSRCTVRARAVCIDAQGDTPRHWDRALVPPEPSCLPELTAAPALLPGRLQSFVQKRHYK
jgi:hypothetical protein